MELESIKKSFFVVLKLYCWRFQLFKAAAKLDYRKTDSQSCHQQHLRLFAKLDCLRAVISRDTAQLLDIYAHHGLLWTFNYEFPAFSQAQLPAPSDQ